MDTKAVGAQRGFGLRDKVGYLLGDVGCNFTFSLISSYMFIFFTQYIGISLMHYSLIILLTKLWDGINDPIVGALADRFHPKEGDKFRPWIFWGSFPLAFSACIMFIDTQAAPYWIRLAVCVGAYLIWDIAYTVVNVPYGSLNATITADPVERSQLSTWRSVGSLLGAFPIAIILPQVLYRRVALPNGQMVSEFLGGRMFVVALILGILSLVCFQLLYRFTVERVRHGKHSGERFHYFRTFANFFSNRTMLAVALTALCSIVFMNSLQTTGTLVYQMYFGDGSLSSFTLITYMPVVLLLPFIKKLVVKYGKKSLCSWPLLLGVVVYVALLLMPDIPVALWVVSTVLTTFSMAFYTLLGWALVSDGIDSIELKTGRREEGTVYATYSLMRKLGQGIGQALIPFLIAVMIPGLDMNNELTWNAAYGLQIKNISVLLCLIGYVIGFILMHFVYDIDKKKEYEMPVLLGRAPAEVDVSIDTVAEGFGRRDE